MKTLADLGAIDAAYIVHYDLACEAELAEEQAWAEVAASALTGDEGAVS